MDITTKLEKTNKKIRTIWRNASMYCTGKLCSRCILDNGSGHCIASLIGQIERKVNRIQKIKK